MNDEFDFGALFSGGGNNRRIQYDPNNPGNYGGPNFWLDYRFGRMGIPNPAPPATPVPTTEKSRESEGITGFLNYLDGITSQYLQTVKNSGPLESLATGLAPGASALFGILTSTEEKRAAAQAAEERDANLRRAEAQSNQGNWWDKTRREITDLARAAAYSAPQLIGDVVGGVGNLAMGTSNETELRGNKADRYTGSLDSEVGLGRVLGGLADDVAGIFVGGTLAKAGIQGLTKGSNFWNSARYIVPGVKGIGQTTNATRLAYGLASGGLSAANNISPYSRGEVSGGEFLAQTAIDALGGGLSAGVAGGTFLKDVGFDAAVNAVTGAASAVPGYAYGRYGGDEFLRQVGAEIGLGGIIGLPFAAAGALDARANKSPSGSTSQGTQGTQGTQGQVQPKARQTAPDVALGVLAAEKQEAIKRALRSEVARPEEVGEVVAQGRVDAIATLEYGADGKVTSINDSVLRGEIPKSGSTMEVAALERKTLANYIVQRLGPEEAARVYDLEVSSTADITPEAVAAKIENEVLVQAGNGKGIAYAADVYRSATGEALPISSSLESQESNTENMSDAPSQPEAATAVPTQHPVPPPQPSTVTSMHNAVDVGKTNESGQTIVSPLAPQNIAEVDGVSQQYLADYLEYTTPATDIMGDAVPVLRQAQMLGEVDGKPVALLPVDAISTSPPPAAIVQADDPGAIYASYANDAPSVDPSPVVSSEGDSRPPFVRVVQDETTGTLHPVDGVKRVREAKRIPPTRTEVFAVDNSLAGEVPVPGRIVQVDASAVEAEPGRYTSLTAPGEQAVVAVIEPSTAAEAVAGRMEAQGLSQRRGDTDAEGGGIAASTPEAVLRESPVTAAGRTRADGRVGQIIEQAQEIGSKIRKAVRGDGAVPKLVTELPREYDDLARAYGAAPHRPDAPDVVAAYQALKDEVGLHYDMMMSEGVDVYVDGGTPYTNTRAMLSDMENGTLRVRRQDYPADHPLAEDSMIQDAAGTPMIWGDIVEATNAYYGHGQIGAAYTPIGIENAYRAHGSMLTPQARQAYATETRARNAHQSLGGESTGRKAVILPSDYAAIDGDMRSSAGALPSTIKGTPDDISAETQAQVADALLVATRSEQDIVEAKRSEGKKDGGHVKRNVQRGKQAAELLRGETVVISTAPGSTMLQTVADALGLSEAELRKAIQRGNTNPGNGAAEVVKGPEKRTVAVRLLGDPRARQMQIASRLQDFSPIVADPVSDFELDIQARASEAEALTGNNLVAAEMLYGDISEGVDASGDISEGLGTQGLAAIYKNLEGTIGKVLKANPNTNENALRYAALTYIRPDLADILHQGPKPTADDLSVALTALSGEAVSSRGVFSEKTLELAEGLSTAAIVEELVRPNAIKEKIAANISDIVNRSGIPEETLKDLLQATMGGTLTPEQQGVARVISRNAKISSQWDTAVGLAKEYLGTRIAKTLRWRASTLTEGLSVARTDIPNLGNGGMGSVSVNALSGLAAASLAEGILSTLDDDDTIFGYPVAMLKRQLGVGDGGLVMAGMLGGVPGIRSVLRRTHGATRLGTWFQGRDATTRSSLENNIPRTGTPEEVGKQLYQVHIDEARRRGVTEEQYIRTRENIMEGTREVGFFGQLFSDLNQIAKAMPWVEARLNVAASDIERHIRLDLESRYEGLKESLAKAKNSPHADKVIEALVDYDYQISEVHARSSAADKEILAERVELTIKALEKKHWDVLEPQERAEAKMLFDNIRTAYDRVSEIEIRSEIANLLGVTTWQLDSHVLGLQEQLNLAQVQSGFLTERLEVAKKELESMRASRNAIPKKDASMADVRQELSEKVKEANKAYKKALSEKESVAAEIKALKEKIGHYNSIPARVSSSAGRFYLKRHRGDGRYILRVDAKDIGYSVRYELATADEVNAMRQQVAAEVIGRRQSMERSGLIEDNEAVYKGKITDLSLADLERIAFDNPYTKKMETRPPRVKRTKTPAIMALIDEALNAGYATMLDVESMSVPEAVNARISAQLTEADISIDDIANTIASLSGHEVDPASIATSLQESGAYTLSTHNRKASYITVDVAKVREMLTKILSPVVPSFVRRNNVAGYYDSSWTTNEKYGWLGKGVETTIARVKGNAVVNGFRPVVDRMIRDLRFYGIDNGLDDWLGNFLESRVLGTSANEMDKVNNAAYKVRSFLSATTLALNAPAALTNIIQGQANINLNQTLSNQMVFGYEYNGAKHTYSTAAARQKALRDAGLTADDVAMYEQSEGGLLSALEPGRQLLRQAINYVANLPGLGGSSWTALSAKAKSSPFYERLQARILQELRVQDAIATRDLSSPELVSSTSADLRAAAMFLHARVEKLNNVTAATLAVEQRIRQLGLTDEDIALMSQGRSNRTIEDVVEYALSVRERYNELEARAMAEDVRVSEDGRIVAERRSAMDIIIDDIATSALKARRETQGGFDMTDRTMFEAKMMGNPVGILAGTLMTAAWRSAGLWTGVARTVARSSNNSTRVASTIAFTGAAGLLTTLLGFEGAPIVSDINQMLGYIYDKLWGQREDTRFDAKVYQQRLEQLGGDIVESRGGNREQGEKLVRAFFTRGVIREMLDISVNSESSIIGTLQVPGIGILSQRAKVFARAIEDVFDPKVGGAEWVYRNSGIFGSGAKRLGQAGIQLVRNEELDARGGLQVGRDGKAKTYGYGQAVREATLGLRANELYSYIVEREGGTPLVSEQDKINYVRALAKVPGVRFGENEQEVLASLVDKAPAIKRNVSRFMDEYRSSVEQEVKVFREKFLTSTLPNGLTGREVLAQVAQSSEDVSGYSDKYAAAQRRYEEKIRDFYAQRALIRAVAVASPETRDKIEYTVEYKNGLHSAIVSLAKRWGAVGRSDAEFRAGYD